MHHDINLYNSCYVLFIIRKYDNIFLSSLVSVIGFALSTLSLKLVRKIWQNKKWSFTKFVRLFICEKFEKISTHILTLLTYNNIMNIAQEKREC